MSAGKMFYGPHAFAIFFTLVLAIPVVVGLVLGTWLSFFVTLLVECVLASTCYKINENRRTNKDWWEFF
jgi:predicted membrane metal-binding protein